MNDLRDLEREGRRRSSESTAGRKFSEDRGRSAGLEEQNRGRNIDRQGEHHQKQKQKRRIKTEEKAKVVAAAWEDRINSMSYYASYFAPERFEEKDDFVLGMEDFILE